MAGTRKTRTVTRRTGPAGMTESHCCTGHIHARDHGPDGHQFHAGVNAHDYSPIPFAVIDEWIHTTPGIHTRLEAAIQETNQVVAGYDEAERRGMGTIFYEQEYDELRIILGGLLDDLEIANGSALARHQRVHQ